MFKNTKQSDNSILELNSNERWREIVEAAFNLVAEKGLEGLRVRQVADQVGINNATLHYYFKNKQALIEAIFQYTIYHIVTTNDPNSDEPTTAIEKLKYHFASQQYQYHHFQERFIVLAEISLRSFRDDAIREMLLAHEASWSEFLMSILQEGIAEGLFRADIDKELAVKHITALFRGMMLSRNQDQDSWQDLTNQFIKWIRV